MIITSSVNPWNTLSEIMRGRDSDRVVKPEPKDDLKDDSRRNKLIFKDTLQPKVKPDEQPRPVAVEERNRYNNKGELLAFTKIPRYFGSF